MGHAQRKLDHLVQARQLLLESRHGMTPTQLAEALHVDRTTAHRYLAELSVENNGSGVYFYTLTVDDIRNARLILSRLKEVIK